MVNTFLVCFIVLLTLMTHQGWAKIDRTSSEVILGEKRLDDYSGRWQPMVNMNTFQGGLTFQDDLYFEQYFQRYLFEKEYEFAHFLKSELQGGLVCPNEVLSEHFEEIRYSFRLLSLSYLLESQWHMKMISNFFSFKQGCTFDFDQWLNKCSPKTTEMSKFVSLLKKYKPRYEETLPHTYLKSDWLKEFQKNDFKYFSHYRINDICRGKCTPEKLESYFNKACTQDESVLSSICSEYDDLYGLSYALDAYGLLAQSNIINTFNKKGEALGCLRRFSNLMKHKEVRYASLPYLFQTMRAHLFHQYQERFLQGRVFFYGSGKEFEEKGLSNLYVMEQPLKIAELSSEEDHPAIIIPPKISAPKKAETPLKKISVQSKKTRVVQEVSTPFKSAFLQAAELRKTQNLEQVQVDMLKFKYDYVFSLNMINKLSQDLKSFMTREALSEMKSFDHLGTKEGPVPLLFIKFMIDMEEFTGLYNLLSVLGDEFYVSNQIDETFNPGPERIKIMNQGDFGKLWQIYILKP